MGRGLRIVIGLVAGVLLANVSRLFAPDVPVVFFGTWVAVAVAFWFVSKPRAQGGVGS